ncbi:MAG: DegV family protein [Lachnospiraceae bacterium]|nr:DegV family protein [Candidatus Merdinaster equi]
MREIVISTETNSDLSDQFLSDNGVLVIPHYYNVEETMYGEEGNRLTIKQFYDEMRGGKKVGTAASNPAVILDKFTELAKQGKDIIHISFSSGLSGGYQNIVNGANDVMDEYPDCKIVVIDTLSASLGEGLMIYQALKLVKEGKTIDEISEAIRSLVPHISVQFTVDDLDYLYRGGRLSKTSAVLGTVINLKPVLHIDDEGKLVALSKVRGRKKSIATMLDNMEQKLGSFKDKQVVIGIMHGDCEEEALQIKGMIEERFGYKDFLIEPIGPSIGAHSGPGTLGLAFLGDAR